MPARKPKSKNPGRGAFERCVSAVSARGGVSSPRGVCAAAGRKKYGAKKFKAMAAAGRKAAKKNKPGGVNRKIRKAAKSGGGAKQRHYEKESYKRAYLTPGKGLHKNNKGGKKRRNQGDAAGLAEVKKVYREFHGKDADKIVFVRERIHEHKHLAGLGELVRLLIHSVDGRYKVTVTFDDGKTILAENKKKNQLFIRGGNQSVDLAEFGIRPPYHETEVLGHLLKVDYYTTKLHLRPEDGGTAIYRHGFRGKLKSRSFTSRKPTVIYDALNKKLEIAGGTYTIPDEGIDG